jgi:hypothetical protein
VRVILSALAKPQNCAFLHNLDPIRTSAEQCGGAIIVISSGAHRAIDAGGVFSVSGRVISPTTLVPLLGISWFVYGGLIRHHQV